MAATDSPAVEVDGLTKRFGARVAVDSLSFSVPRGSVAGFIGPNGAGKTTTLAMLLGLLEPTEGRGAVLGIPLGQPERILPRVGALIEGPALYPSLSGADNLRVLAAAGRRDPARIPAVLDQVGLADRAGDRFGQYSLGMKQRLGIAAALLADPELLVLDEPTNGLDPAGIREIRELVAAIAAEGRTVVVSSHLLAEVEQVCDHLVVVHRGTARYAGPAHGFMADRQRSITITPEHPADTARLRALVAADGWHLEADPASAALAVAVRPGGDAHTAAAALNRLAHHHGLTLAGLSPVDQSLEDRYLSLVEGAVR